jgi:LuxR family maltose regulon positive regulatory protein
LLARLLDAAEGGGRGRSVIEILLLQAVARRTTGDLAGARASLTRALARAEPEGYVRLVVDAGPPLAALLETVTKDEGVGTYARRLLGAFGQAPRSAHASQEWIEPLSERELDVLRLLATDLDGPGIARELVVSLHTVRSHTKAIYSKLGVRNRRAAVTRAAELGLLPPTGG